MEYYSKRINENPDWEPVRVFADEGISGVNTDKRDQFNEMIEMCKAGKIDVIVTKSIHRFGRNTLDTIKYVRLLRTMGIDVIFEQEGLHGLNAADEQFITIYASMAQSYSTTLSENVKWGYQRSFARGEAYFGGRMFGYIKGENGMEIVPREAEAVRLVYEMYLDGKSTWTIAEELEARGYLTTRGNKKWTHNGIDNILTNEKYMGDALSQKTYIPDVLTKKQVKNTGQRPQYYVTDHHEAIVSKEMFKRVQFERTRRKSLSPVSGKTTTNAGRFSPKYALTGLMLCGECGSPYRRITWYRKNGKIVVWRCTNRLDNGVGACRNSHTIYESALHDALAKLIHSLASEQDALAQTLEEYAADVIEQEKGDSTKRAIQKKLEQTEKKLTELLAADIVSEELIEQLSAEYDRLQQELDRLGEQADRGELEKAYMCGVREYIHNADLTRPEYDDRFVREIIEQIIVKSDERLYVRLRGGYETEIEI